MAKLTGHAPGIVYDAACLEWARLRIVCRACHAYQGDHGTDGKCLFAPTVFAP